MPRLRLNEINPGTVIADDIYNLDGNLLFPARTELTERQIDILYMWGVDLIAVEGEQQTPEETGQPLDDFERLRADLAVHERFQLVRSSHPVVVAIREIAARAAMQASENGRT